MQLRGGNPPIFRETSQQRSGTTVEGQVEDLLHNSHIQLNRVSPSLRRIDRNRGLAANEREREREIRRGAANDSGNGSEHRE